MTEQSGWGIGDSVGRGSAPIALFVYNRPVHTRKTVEALRANLGAEDSDLFIFSDAPKRAEAEDAVSDVRRYVREVTGFKSVTLIEREKNWGLADSIIDGVGRLTNEYDRVIVIEDDLLTSKYFLEFMNLGLERYASEEQVMQVSGYMFPARVDVPDDALFLPFITSWGWATWRRAWRHFDATAAAFANLRQDAKLKRRFDLNGNYAYFKMLEAQQAGKVDSWAIRWYLSVFMRGGLALYPTRSLVYNEGFDGSGVNCAVSKLDQDSLEQSFRVRRLPSQVAASPAALDVMKQMPRPKRTLRAIATRLSNIVRNR